MDTAKLKSCNKDCMCHARDYRRAKYGCSYCRQRPQCDILKEHERKQNKLWLQNNPDKHRKYDEKYRETHREHIRKYSREWHLQQRRELIQKLGNKCSCQGINCWHVGLCSIKDYRVLQLDHIKGKGNEERRRLSKRGIRTIGIYIYYLKHIDEARRKLQVLCANCNWSKRYKNNETNRIYK